MANKATEEKPALSMSALPAGCVLNVALGNDTQWPLTLLLDKLCEAADLLLHHCDYDGDGWEKIQYAMNEGRKRSEQITDSLKHNIWKKKGSESQSSDLLASAECNIDMCTRRGQVCRGAYIGSNGVYYLNKKGEWTHGTKSDDNWWNTLTDAKAFLYEMKEANDLHHLRKKNEGE